MYIHRADCNCNCNCLLDHGPNALPKYVSARVWANKTVGGSGGAARGRKPKVA
jgi:hypothetical protein